MSIYDPRNRKEIYYRGILDGDPSLPDPQTREEIFLKAIAEAMPIITEATVKQTTGTSATDVMSQAAVTGLFDDLNDFYFRPLANVNQINFVSGYIAYANGNVIGEGTDPNWKTSEWIKVDEGVQFYLINLTGAADIVATVACYDENQAYIQASSSHLSYNGTLLTIDSDTKYIRFSSSAEHAINVYTYDPVGVKGIRREVELLAAESNRDIYWLGKRWIGFGTSITDTSYTDPQFLEVTGKYPPYLASLAGLQFTNAGIAGASICGDIRNKVLSGDFNLSNYDLITVEGGVNDHATSKPIGTVGDTSADTYAGSIYQIANYVNSHSNGTLIFLTDYSGRYVHINPTPAGTDFYGDCAPTKVNTLGLLQSDYVKMMIDQCHFYGFPVIDAGQTCGINLLTGTYYLVDHIHSTQAGGEQYANTIWSSLKNIKPRVIP